VFQLKDMYKIVYADGEQVKVISEHPTWRIASWHLDKLIAGKNPTLVVDQPRLAIIKGEATPTSEMVELYLRTV
jgi:hypothetical protein